MLLCSTEPIPRMIPVTRIFVLKLTNLVLEPQVPCGHSWRCHRICPSALKKITIHCYWYEKKKVLTKWQTLCLGLNVFIHWSLDKPRHQFEDDAIEIHVPHFNTFMARRVPFFPTTFSKWFSCMKIIVFWFNFHWNLSPGMQFTITYHWFTQWLRRTSS